AIEESKPADTDLEVLFLSMISQSHQVKNALATEIQTLGGTIANGTTARGKIYRAWMDVKAVFTGHDRETILSNCEAGEDAAQKAYTSALQEEGIPAFIRELLEEQQIELKASHDEIKSLRDQYKESPVTR
ncbi:MAG TPA: PA2169 family four-helix-bundle protein, partial [Chitinophagaceae bacterium]|nr:PA2169 family four-helix-bundle protein [Chitinophagaceae bacterium]